jgi:formate C-acetyltransferase
MGKVSLSEIDKKVLAEAVDYWQGRCEASRSNELYSWRHKNEPTRNDLVKVGLWVDTRGIPVGRICIDYTKVLNKGFDGVIAEAKSELEKLSLYTIAAKQKKDFLEAVIVACNAVIAFANRYADLTSDMASTEVDIRRKKELEDISEICRHVPAKPARTFREAIQSFWFTHLALHLELNSDGNALGRFTQYMYPFYTKDIEAGRITREEAIELLELLFIKFSEIGKFWSQRVFERDMGNLLQNAALGGVTPDDKDATNELDYLMVEAQRRVRVFQPSLSVLYHDKMPADFLLKCAELVATGLGMPAFFNSDLNVAGLLNHGVSLEDARNHCIIGCVERGFSGTCKSMLGGALNMPKMLELALNNGRDALTGKQVGPQTGEAGGFHSYGELCEAVKKQLRYFLERGMELENIGHAINQEYFPQPFVSALVNDCIKKGLEVNAGGARYYMDGWQTVGTVDLGDSLAAIKKNVFEEKRITMSELQRALAANFEGYEELHRLLLDSPKYGNDDPYVDDIVREWYSIFYDEHQLYRDHLGGRLEPATMSVSWHGPLGVQTAALPSGRKARVPLSDGSVSAHPGCDKNGPTALIASATKVIDTVKYESTLLNMKFHPTSFADASGLRKLVALIKTYMDLGGHHIQFNVVSAETLRDAQAHPENYRDLIVRVAGFSAFFIHLDSVVQDEIIRRTELSL